MAYRIARLTVTLNKAVGHFCCFELLWCP